VFLFGALRLGMVKLSCFKAEKHQATVEMNLALYTRRWAFITQSIMSMTFAWCILGSGTAAVSTFLQSQDLSKLGYKPNGAAVRAVLAMVVSIVAFVVIRVLDKISDMLKGMSEKEGERAVRGIIRGLGIMVGFSWEQAFAGGVEAIVETEPIDSKWFPVGLQFALAIIIGFGVVPAWKMYILRNLIKCQAEHAEREEQHKKEVSDNLTPYAQLRPERAA